MRIWLTGRKSKASYVVDDNGYRLGSEVKAKLKKSRFGTEGRECTFKILWGGESVAIQDEESWFEAIKSSSNLEQSGAWYSLVYEDGTKEILEVKGYIYNKQMFEAKNDACKTFCDNNNIKFNVLFKENIYE